jgi:hypothetical protein
MNLLNVMARGYRGQSTAIERREGAGGFRVRVLAMNVQDAHGLATLCMPVFS